MCVLVCLCAAGSAHAQSATTSTASTTSTTSAGIERPPLGSRLTAEALSDLPSGGNLLTLIDTVIPEVISDRVDTGGLSTGSAARLGARGNSWTQTVFRLDGVDISSSDGSGSPLMLPGVLNWDHVDVATGLMPIDINAPGLAISLAPRRPTQTWTRVIEATGSIPAFVSASNLTFVDRELTPYIPPPIARLHSAAYVNVLFSGPMVPDKVGIVLAGTWNGSSKFERSDPTQLDATHGSLFTHLVYTPGGRDEVRVVGWVQRSTAPFENRLAFNRPTASERTAAAHGQLVWDRKTSDRLWSAFAAYTVRERALDLARTSSIAIERVTDGPAEALIYPGPSTDRSWSAGLRLNPSESSQGSAGRQGPSLGVELSGDSVRMRPAFSGRIGEAVNGLPARVWDFTDPGVPAKWTDVSLAAYAADRIQPHPRVTLDGGIRYEYVSASAATGTDRISWNALLPRAGIRWELTDWAHIATLAGYSRTAHRLTLTDLAWGDASAPSGSVYRWNAAPSAIHAPQPSEIGALIARVGPGSRGIAGFASIDPDLKRPYMDELTFGFEGRPTPSTVFRLTGIGRRERNMVAVVNEGAPASAYTVIRFSDEGLFGEGSLLPVFNRQPATFGADRYTLTNPVDDETTFVGAELTGQAQTSRLFLIFGVTAGRSEGLSANRGFLAIENDAALIGELYTNPNARTYAQGRLFTERGYTIKQSSVYHFEHDIQFGFAARYQDGQHFSRLVVVPNLNQGPEIVRAFRNGRTRFTFTGTLDARLQKGFAFGSQRLAVVLEGYNLLNMGLEVEEVQVTGALSRATTAVLPPRVLHVGVRLTF
jgi:hypothetical protein